IIANILIHNLNAQPANPRAKAAENLAINNKGLYYGLYAVGGGIISRLGWGRFKCGDSSINQFSGRIVYDASDPQTIIDVLSLEDHYGLQSPITKELLLKFICRNDKAESEQLFLKLANCISSHPKR